MKMKSWMGVAVLAAVLGGVAGEAGAALVDMDVEMQLVLGVPAGKQGLVSSQAWSGRMRKKPEMLYQAWDEAIQDYITVVTPQFQGEGMMIETNPLFSDQGHTGTNPLFGSFVVTSQGVSHDANEVTWTMTGRMVLTLADGPGTSYSGDVTFVAKGTKPATTGEVGPVRWMAPEARMLASDAGDGEVFVVEAGSSLTTMVVPEPGMAGMVGAAGVVLARRRR